MFFFIGGIQPKAVELDEGKRICPVCGLQTAKMKRLDHYLSLFFIPVLRLKKGEIFLECVRCGIIPPDGDDVSRGRRPILCPNCNREVSDGYRYCPFCGRRL